MSQHNNLIYLDYAATTPVAQPVAAKMSEYLTVDGIFGNPASRSHGYGWQAEEAVETARGQVAEVINADPREIVFTSGATESDNLAIKGAAHFYHSRGKHIITSKIEHKAVLDTCRELEQEGFEITYLENTRLENTMSCLVEVTGGGGQGRGPLCLRGGVIRLNEPVPIEARLPITIAKSNHFITKRCQSMPP
ncbi:aminotransferase class V-fold PLP-dependent enzyme, partial [uncultured Psychrobacter sp.]|uniref:aminotransferase class V-fold PLP-dependent enzyme n=1 Tax=uncultured Psychrobacter sp. TaxID=259303 RepID=UPI00260D05F4